MTFFYKMFEIGGPILLAIILCSMILVYVFLVKWFQFHRAQINAAELIAGLVNVLRRDGMIEAITLCDNTPGPVAKLLNRAIHAYQNDDDIQKAIDAQVREEVPLLESKLSVLATMAHVTPLLGLLGTVVGLLATFFEMKSGNVIDLQKLSEGVYTSLTCTAAGLCVAIPCHIAYNYLLSRIEHLCMDMEKAADEILYFFEHRQDEPGEEK